MKKILKHFVSASAVLALSACSFLDPLPDGSYTEENYRNYPKLIEGYVFKAYQLLPTSYYNAEFIGSDCCTDDLVYTSSSASMRLFSIGSAQPSSYDLASCWERDYTAINYVNRFLYKELGLSTRYLIDETENAKLQNYLEGDALGLRAWYLFDLVKKFAGKDAAGNLLGVPLFTQPNDLTTFDEKAVRRATLDECMEQIIRDCNDALNYLPEANRDFVVAPTSALIDGAARYRSLDCVAVKALKALVYLFWASPAYNPDNDMSRWEKAAKCAAEVMSYKLGVEGARIGGFDPKVAMFFTNPNDPEVIWPSNWEENGYESKFYPLGFNGSAVVAPTQELVDAFPMANGYPVTDARSGYDENNPYVGRDPRFYANINANGSEVRRGGITGDVMYTFNTKDGGADAPGLVSTSTSGYYVKKYIYNLWNKNDKTTVTASSSIFFLRWTQMCLAYAEAVNQLVGPTSTKYGISAKAALAYVRSRTTQDGVPGLGVERDPYLDECASAGQARFAELVRNEWRIETCFEGWRFFNLRRWGASTDELNTTVHGVSISASGNITHPALETRNFPSQWLPLPYLEVRKCKNLVQNEGWDNWK